MTIMHKSFYTRLLPVAITLLLTACVTPPPVGTQPPISWAEHVAQLEKLQRYQVRGAFAYITPERRQSARFFLQQTDPQHYRLLLLNPLGNTALEIIGQPNSTQLKDGDGKVYSGPDGAELIARLTGMQIPVDNLRHWILGVPGTGDTYRLTDQRISQLQHATPTGEWTMHYKRYDLQTQPVLPTDMELLQGNQRIRLKIDDWIL